MAVHASHWRYIVAHVLERRVRHAIASQNDMAISRNRCLARVCVCRYSGILFAFASLESFLSPAPTRSLFGMITVPTRLYPWALLIVLQLLPNISLLGHLSGLIVGMLCVPASVSRATYLFVCMCVWSYTAACVGGSRGGSGIRPGCCHGLSHRSQACRSWSERRSWHASPRCEALHLAQTRALCLAPPPTETTALLCMCRVKCVP